MDANHREPIVATANALDAETVPEAQETSEEWAERSCRIALMSMGAFTAWLQTMSLWTVCGHAGAADASPLAHFLSDMCGRHVRVGRREVLICGRCTDDSAAARFHTVAIVPLPAWAQAVEWRCGEVTANRMLEVVARTRLIEVGAVEFGQHSESTVLPKDR